MLANDKRVDISNSTVMIVDDVPDNLDILVDLLGGEFNVSVATDGESALQHIAAHPPDIILLDIMMPVMDGFEMCRKLKEDVDLRDIPVIFVSAMDESVNKITGLELGGVDYITKPYDPQEVLARTRTHLVLRKLFVENEAARRTAIAAGRSKTAFLSAMSNQLRSPLNAILGFTDILRDGDFGEINGKQAEYLERIERDALQLLDLVNNILDTANIDAGDVELYVERFDLGGVIEAVTTSLRPAFRRKRISLEIDGEAYLGDVVGDRKKYLQILSNLLSNAAKFTGEDGDVRIRTERLSNGDVRLTVVDTGIGIRADRLDRLFSEFTLEGGKQDTAHVGFGLHLAKRLAELHGGRIGVRSEFGVGSEFWVQLPQELALTTDS